jgi:hypothetical protein
MTLFESEIRKLNLPGYIVDEIVSLRNICMEAGAQPAQQPVQQPGQKQAQRQPVQTQPQQPVQQPAQPNAQQQPVQQPAQANAQQQPAQQPPQPNTNQQQEPAQQNTQQNINENQIDAKKLMKEFTGYLNGCKETVKNALIKDFGENGKAILKRVEEWSKSNSPINFDEEILPFFKSTSGKPVDKATINKFRQNFQKYFGLKIKEAQPVPKSKEPLNESCSKPCLEALDVKNEVEEDYGHLLHLLNFYLNEDWYRFTGNFKRTFEFKLTFHPPLITVYISPVYNTPQHKNEPDAIEVLLQGKSKVLMDFLTATVTGTNPDDMKELVSKELTELLTNNDEVVRYIKDGMAKIIERSHQVDVMPLLDEETCEHQSYRHTMMKVKEFLENCNPNYANMTLGKFIETENLDIDTFIELLNYYGCELQPEKAEAAINEAIKKNMKVLQAITFITKKYETGRYLGSNSVQLVDGRIWRNGLIFNRDKVLSRLQKMYDEYMYVEVVETMSDREYRFESFRREMMGDDTPLPRERTVKKPRHENPLPFKQWATTPNEETGKTPLDTVLDQLEQDDDTRGTYEEHFDGMSRVANSTNWPEVE